MKRFFVVFGFVILLFIVGCLSVLYYLDFRSKKEITYSAVESSLAEEKKDILERANWLCDQVAVSPEKLMETMPSILGPISGEWAIYSCAYTVEALKNICNLYPEYREQYLPVIEKIVENSLSETLSAYDRDAWGGEDPFSSLESNNSHMSYLSLVAWMITDYKLCGGENYFDIALHDCCETLCRRMQDAPYMCLPTFPNETIYMPDMLVTLVALHNYNLMYQGKYEETIQQWKQVARAKLIDENSGLLMSGYYQNPSHPIPQRGSYAALNCYYLSLFYPDFAKEQYDRLKKAFWSTRKFLWFDIFGIKENSHPSQSFYFDIDAGPVAFGLSPSGTAWAIGSATYFEDWSCRYRMLQTAEYAGYTKHEKNSRHYWLGEFAIVGEAVTLAMRTHTSQLHYSACSQESFVRKLSYAIDANGTSVDTRFINLDTLFYRKPVDSGSWASYLLQLPLHEVGYPCHYFNGEEKQPNYQCGVLTFDCGQTDLMQCADAAIRLRAEYLFSQGKYKDIAFNFTNGWRCEYIKWAEGYRVHLSGNRTWWELEETPNYSYREFRKYLDMIFMYAGSASLSKELKHIPIQDIQAGDLLIIGGHPGHVETILDVLYGKNCTLIKIMLCQSYMPAQEIEILRNDNEDGSPWLSIDLSQCVNGMSISIITPSYIFSSEDIYRWKD